MSEQYVPNVADVKSAYVDAHQSDDRGGIRTSVTRPEFDRFIAKVRAEARAEGVRETARYIERIAPKGLIDRASVLADMRVAAGRLEIGIHANGRDRIEKVGPE